VHTRRCVFAPPQGSAAAETNPTDPLLVALEESSRRSLAQYLAYLDLCMVSENNVDSWRRAAFFEETGETYKRIIYACLRPLEHMATKLLEGLDGSSVDKTADILSQQMRSPTDRPLYENVKEVLNDFQVFLTFCRIFMLLLVGLLH
jgi:nucleoporin NDC1